MLTVEVFDAAGSSYGTYFVQVDTADFDGVCSTGVNAAEAQVLSTHHSFWYLFILRLWGVQHESTNPCVDAESVRTACKLCEIAHVI